MLSPLAAAADELRRGMDGVAEVFFEVPLAAGVPDMVVVAFDSVRVAQRHHAGLGPVVDVSAVRTLAALGVVTDLDALSTATGLSRGHLRRGVLPSLAAAGWVEILGAGQIRLLHEFAPVVRWAVAVEAKRSDWAGALSQAQRMLPAADRVFVALDAARATRAVAHAKHMASAGVGVVTVDAASPSDRDPVKVVSMPSQGRPRMPRGHRAPELAAKALLGERAWKLHRAGRRHGPTSLVFGRDLNNPLNGN